ncbi:MAG: putative porin [Flavobacterium psychrophilum]
MRLLFFILFLLFTLVGFSQETTTQKLKKSLLKSQEQKTKEKAEKAPITSYRIISLANDTTYVDTSLTIAKEYNYNYLRKDNFGLFSFLNEGQTYTTLNHSLKTTTAYPEIGMAGKHFNYLQVKDISYYSVATPLTDLYFKTVMEQGQSSDAFVTLNTSERFNFSIAYKGVRSLGKYINQLTSAGNFRFTTNYHNKSNTYFLKAHYTGQDLLNGENGGITTPNDFESQNSLYKERQRLEVYLTDAKSFLKGKRLFVDHSYRFYKSKSTYFALHHQFEAESKFFEYNQTTVSSTIGTKIINRFGESYKTADINDQLHYNKLYSKIGVETAINRTGTLLVYADTYRYNYFYNTLLILNTITIPSRLNDAITTVGADYQLKNKKWNVQARYKNALTDQAIRDAKVQLLYQFSDQLKGAVSIENSAKIPDLSYSLFQSSYVNYNWYQTYTTEKSTDFKVSADSKWMNVKAQFSNYKDKVFFANTSTNDTIQILAPSQYNKSISYASVQANKEIKYWKLALDNTLLFQTVSQDDAVLNVPKWVTRNSLYFSDYFFEKALYLQSGITFNYFTKYYANGYNPVVADFFVQQKKQIGDFATYDFFINARVRQTRIFLKAEHFNAAWSATNKFYSAPDYPFRDFIIRFGLVWNFFK